MNIKENLQENVDHQCQRCGSEWTCPSICNGSYYTYCYDCVRDKDL